MYAPGRPSGKEKILEFETGTTRSHSMKALWKRLWTCRKTDYSSVVHLLQV